MSRTLRRGGWGNPLYQHMYWFERPEDERQEALYNQWKYRKVYADHWNWGPPRSVKSVNNRWDRRRWNLEARKEEPQLPKSHRHWGLWDWW